MTTLPTLELENTLVADVLATFGGKTGYLEWLAKNIESRYVTKAVANFDVTRESGRNTAIKAAETKVVAKLAEAVAAESIKP